MAFSKDMLTEEMWIDSKEHSSFRDLRQQPAMPCLLVFTTRS